MKLSFSQMIDPSVIQALTDSFYQMTGLSACLVAPEGETIAASGWRNICTQFHQGATATQSLCRESRLFFAETFSPVELSVQPEPIERRCKNGMVQIGVPIVAGDHYLATLFLGQFFFEPPDVSVFRRQARFAGFEEELYLQSLSEIPIYSREKVKHALHFYSRLVTLLTELGRKHVKLLSAQADLQKSEARFRDLFENANDAIYVSDADGRFLDANKKACLQLGYDYHTLLEKRLEDVLLHSERGGRANETAQVFEAVHQGKNGELIPVEVSRRAFVFKEDKAWFSIVRDLQSRKEAEEALRESEKRFRTFFQSAAAGLTIIRPDGVMLEVNPFLTFFVGCPKEEMVGRSVESFTHPKDRKFTRKLYKCLSSGKMPYVAYEKRYLHSSGSVVWGHTTVAPVHAAEGTLQYYVALVQDITKSKEAETALEKSRIRLEEAQRIAHLGSWDWNLVDQKVNWSKEMFRIFGLDPQSYSPNYGSLISMVHPEDRPYVEENAVMARKEYKQENLEYRIVRPDGSVRHLLAQGELQRDEHGRPCQMVGTVLDITDRKLAEGSLKEALADAEAARDNIDTILRSIADGLVVTDSEGRVILMNRAAEKVLGITLDEAFNQLLSLLLAQRTVPGQAAPQCKPWMESGAREWTLEGESGSQHRTIQSQTAPVRNGKMEPAGMITLLRDVTRDREVDRLKNEFISTAAHELRTPLTCVKGFSEVLFQSPDLPRREMESYLAIIVEKSRVLEGIINALLDLSRVESGKVIQLNRRSGDLRELLKRIVTQYQRGEERHQFTVSLPEAPLWVQMDQEKIVQVMENLLSNAVKFSPSGGAVHVACIPMEQMVQVSVCDQGVGISPENVKRVFERFFRVDSTDSAVPGLELGMPIVKSIIEAHGGEIELESALGKGTSVRFTLPTPLVREDRAVNSKCR